MRDYDSLLTKNNWDNLFIQKEYFSLLQTPSENKYKKEIQEEYLIETNSQISQYRNYNNNSFTNSKEITEDICPICRGRKIIKEENNSTYKCNFLKSKNENNYTNVNNNNVNVVESNTYKTLLALPKNEIDYVNNIEITVENKYDNNFLTDDEYTKERRIINNNKNKYNNKFYNINNNKTIKNIDYNNNTSKVVNTSNKTYYSQLSEDIALRRNQNDNYRNNSIYRKNYRIWKKNNYQNDNNYNNNTCNYNRTNRYTYYRDYSRNTSDRINQYQSKSQIKSIEMNKNHKRKLYRFEDGKGVKVIYQK